MQFFKLPGTSVREASKNFNIPKSTIHDMKKRDFPDPSPQRVEKSATGPLKERGRNKTGAGRPLTYNSTLESSILSWILEMRDLHLPVSCQGVRNKVSELITPQVPTFKASSGWLAKFFKRHNLTFRARTSIAQKLRAQLEERVQAF